MKKIMFILALFVIIFAIASYSLSSVIVDFYEKESMEVANQTGFKSVENNYDRGIFSTKITQKIVLDKNYVSEILGTEFSDDLHFEEQSSFAHSPLALIFGFKNTGKMRYLGENKIFKDGEILRFSGIVRMNGKSDMDFTINPITYSSDDVKIDISPIIGKVLFDYKKSLIYSSFFAVQDTIFSDENVKISLKDAQYRIDFTKPVRDDENISDFTANLKIGELNASSTDSEFTLKNIAQNIVFNVLGEKFNILLNGKIDDLKFLQESHEFNLNSLDLDANASDLSVAFYENTITPALGDMSYFELMGLAADFLQSNPKLNVSNFSFKNSNGKSLKATFSIGLDKFDIADLARIGEFAFARGSLKVDESLYDELTDDFAGLVKDEFFVKNGDILELELEYDPQSLDVIINDNLSLREFFESEAYGLNDEQIWKDSEFMRRQLER